MTEEQLYVSLEITDPETKQTRPCSKDTDYITVETLGSGDLKTVCAPISEMLALHEAITTSK